MINNMVAILNRSILISKVCNSNNIQKWSHIFVHMYIIECKSVSSLLLDPYSISISLSVSVWILQNVQCACTPYRLTVYIEYTVNL